MKNKQNTIYTDADENTLTSTSQLHLQEDTPPLGKWTQECESLDNYLLRKA